MTIKAIETVYNGYRFRSRLEARWAVFFDTLGVTYEYEKEGYDLGEAGWYLPDFWLPEQQCWVEVKPGNPTDEECVKAHALALQGGYPVVFAQQIPDVSHSFKMRVNKAAAKWAEEKKNNPFAPMPRVKLSPQDVEPQLLFSAFIDPETDELKRRRVSWQECFICGNMTLIDAEYYWSSCECSQRLFDAFNGRPQEGALWRMLTVHAYDGRISHPHLLKAYEAAQQARFEHGETPTVNKL